MIVVMVVMVNCASFVLGRAALRRRLAVKETLMDWSVSDSSCVVEKEVAEGCARGDCGSHVGEGHRLMTSCCVVMCSDRRFWRYVVSVGG